MNARIQRPNTRLATHRVVDPETGEIIDTTVPDTVEEAVRAIDRSRVLRIEWPEHANDDEHVSELAQIIVRHPGDTPVELGFTSGRTIRLPQEVYARCRLYADLHALLGAATPIDIMLTDQAADARRHSRLGPVYATA